MNLANSARTSAADVRTVSAAQGVPNKPMVPTAPISPVVNPSRPLRRHIGQSLDSAGNPLDLE